MASWATRALAGKVTPPLATMSAFARCRFICANAAGHACDPARCRLEVLELLSEAIGLRVGEPRDIASRACEAHGEALGHRVTAARRHHDGDHRGGLARGLERRR